MNVTMIRSGGGDYEGTCLAVAEVMQIAFESRIYWEGGEDPVLLFVGENSYHGKIADRHYGGSIPEREFRCLILVKDVKKIEP